MNCALIDFHTLLFRDWASAPNQCTNRVRSRALGTPRSWLARLEARLWQFRQQELERRLAGCENVVELEARLRGLDRIPPHRRYE